MKIIVCVKQVPDTSGKVAVNANGTLDRASMNTICNPDDLSALEKALEIKDKMQCRVCVISMGPMHAEEMLREMLAMGADEAVLVSDRKFGGSDTYATSQILAAAIQEYGFDQEDMIFCGRQAIDGDTAQVGPQIAEKLGVPQVSYAMELEIKESEIYIRRMHENGSILVKTKTPCLVTCVKELADPRYVSVPGIMSAYQKPLHVFDYDKLKENPLICQETIGLQGSPTNILTSFVPCMKQKSLKMMEADREGCELLAGILTMK